MRTLCWNNPLQSTQFAFVAPSTLLAVVHEFFTKISANDDYIDLADRNIDHCAKYVFAIFVRNGVGFLRQLCASQWFGGGILGCNSSHFIFLGSLE